MPRRPYDLDLRGVDYYLPDEEADPSTRLHETMNFLLALEHPNFVTGNLEVLPPEAMLDMFKALEDPLWSDQPLELVQGARILIGHQFDLEFVGYDGLRRRPQAYPVKAVGIDQGDR